MLFRTEFDVQTNQSREIDQRAYRNLVGDILVLDYGVDAPDGFSEFDPMAENISD